MLVLLAGLILYGRVNYVVATNESIDISCTNQSYCQQVFGYADCSAAGSCVCDDYCYNNSNTCVECPGIGESCADSNCCNTDYLACLNGVCFCIYQEYCWTLTDSDRETFQRAAQCVLGVALILTGIVLFFLFWKACSRRHLVHRRLGGMVPADSFLSLNSIQRLVLMQLQDRPPPYSPEFMPSHKNSTEINEPPPSYIEAVGGHGLNQGQDNQVCFLGELSPVTSSSEEPNVLRSTNVFSVYQNSSLPTNNVTIEPNNSITVLPVQNSATLVNTSLVPIQNTALSSNIISNAAQHGETQQITTTATSQGTSRAGTSQNYSSLMPLSNVEVHI